MPDNRVLVATMMRESGLDEIVVPQCSIIRTGAIDGRYGRICARISAMIGIFPQKIRALRIVRVFRYQSKHPIVV